MPSHQPERGAPRRTPEATERLRTGLHRAETAIIEAELADRPSERFLAAHHAALQVAAVVLALRTSPAVARAAQSAPQRLADGRRRGARAGRVGRVLRGHRGQARRRTRRRDSIVSAREADDLVRDARAFLSLVERSVG